MTFESFLQDMKLTAHCPKCNKPFDSLVYENDPDTNDLLIKVECHGEKHIDRMTRASVEDMEKLREKNLHLENVANEVKAKSKKRTVIVDPAYYNGFSKFRKLR